MTDLTKITTPFGLLDPETQEALKAHPGPYEVFNAAGEWMDLLGGAWVNCYTYRVKPQPLTKPSIDWSHVAPEYKWLARDEDETGWIFAEKPTLIARYWAPQRSFRRACVFASYTPGTCDWRDSLVERPE